MTLLKWHIQKGRFGNKEIGKLGDIELFSIWYDGLISRDDPKRYKRSCDLPGFEYTKHAETMKELKDDAETITQCWIDRAGLVVKQ